MRTRKLAARCSGAATPRPSWPNTQAQLAGSGVSYKSRASDSVVTTNGTASRATQSGRLTRSCKHNEKCAPWALRSTLGDHAAAVPAPSNTCVTPAAAQTRKIVPTLPGSCTASSHTERSSSRAGNTGTGGATTTPPVPAERYVQHQTPPASAALVASTTPDRDGRLLGSSPHRAARRRRPDAARI